MRVPDPEIQRQPPRDGPVVLHVGAEVVDGAGGIRGIALGVELERDAVSEDEDLVVGGPPVRPSSDPRGPGV